MDSQEDSSSAIAPSLMANLLQFEGLVRLVHRYSSPALVAPDSVAAESAPVPKKHRLSLPCVKDSAAWLGIWNSAWQLPK